LTLALHRVFPWDERAPAGAPYSPSFAPAQQGSGRFDLVDAPVLYLGESAEHAAGEMLQGFRGRPFHESALRRFGHPLALVRVDVPDDLAAAIVDLDDPAQLLALGLHPSDVVSEDRSRTRGIAARLYEGGATGLRWWSKLSGDWHGVVLFLARAPLSRLTLGDPEPLSPSHPAVVSACRQLAIDLDLS
jgi:hypothetical protein